MKNTRLAVSARLILYICATWTFCYPARAQAPVPSILAIDLENKVQYREDAILDPSKWATDPGIVPVTTPKDFGQFLSIADIVAVNGQPAKGVALYRARTVNLTPTPAPGNAISDVLRNGAIDQMFEILNPDGTPIGTILASGLAAGPVPPGSPAGSVQANLAIFGGTGAFFGARGQVAQGATTVPDRQASVNEDPSRRRINGGGGKVRIMFSVIPMEMPQVAVIAGYPHVLHSRDLSFVAPWNPATPGEVLRLFVTGLGPTTPSVPMGQPFPASPTAVVSSPVSVTINGRPAGVLSAIGVPGAVDSYQVDVQVPPDTPRGIATLQVTAAWIQGPGVSIPIQ